MKSVNALAVGSMGIRNQFLTFMCLGILAAVVGVLVTAQGVMASEKTAGQVAGSDTSHIAIPLVSEVKSAQSHHRAEAGNVSAQAINLPTRVPAVQTAPTGKPPAGKPAKSKKKASTGKKQDEKRRGTPPCLSWVDPEVEPRAALLCVHGLGLYNGTYEPFGKRMAKLGIATYAIDMRGFGSWMEAKGRETVDFEAALADVKAVLRVIHRAHPGLPVFLLGESMGGAIALQSTAEFPEFVDGLISSVPAGDRFQQKRTALKVAINMLKAPNRPIDVGTGVIEKATENQEVRESWSKDPLARLNISPRELLQFQVFMNQNHAAAKKIKTTPVLIIQGCKDRLVRPEGTVELYNELTTPDRQLMLMPGSEHLVFEEGQFTDEVVEKTLAWINAHVPKPKTASEPALP